MKLNKIAIHSVPRSGSSWLGKIFDSHPSVAYRFQPLFSYTHKSELNEKSSLEDINFFYKNILNSTDHFVLQQQNITENKVPDFSKDKYTHIAYKEVRYHNILENLLIKDKDIKIVGLIRNPFSVIYSWLNAPKEFKKELGWKIEEEWRFASKKNQSKPEEFNGYEKWKEVSFLFLDLKEKYPERFYLLNYDTLLEDKAAEVKKVFSFCELELTNQTLEFINKSSNTEGKDAYSVYRKKSKDDAWKTELPSFIVDEIKADDDFKQLNKIFKFK